MAYKEFAYAGIDPFKDFASMEFSGKHDNVVKASVVASEIARDIADAGKVSTETKGAKGSSRKHQ